MSICDWLAARGYGNWVIAPRLTDNLRRRGYETAIHQKTFRKLEAEHERETGEEATRIAADYERRFGLSLAYQLAKVRS